MHDEPIYDASVPDRRLNLRFSALQGSYWAAYCVLFSFMVPLLRNFGYGKFSVGVMMTLMAVGCMLAQPLWGLVCDHVGHVKAVLVANLIVTCLIALALPGAIGNPVLTGLLLLLMSASMQSMPSVIDSWTLQLLNAGEKVDYGLTRSIGSFFYAITALGFGMLLDLFDVWIRIPVFIGLSLAAILSAWITPPPPRQVHHDSEGRMSDTFRSITCNRKYLVFLASVMLAFVGYGASNSFYPILITELGGDNAALGLGFLLGGLGQVPTMIGFGFLVRKGVGVQHLLALSLFFLSFKGILLSLCPTAVWAIGAQALEMLTIGLFLPAAIHYINETVDQRAMVTAQLLLSSSFGMGSILGSFVGGLVAEWFGTRPMMLALNLFGFLGFAVFLLNRNQASIERPPDHRDDIGIDRTAL
jgi:PPP family 3-phenylpropionic acid transporter